MFSPAAIFADYYGTLAFHEKLHGIVKKGDLQGNRILIEDSISKKLYTGFDVSTSLYRVFMSESTRFLASSLSVWCPFYIVSGARPKSMKQRLKYLDFADGFILEGGGIICDTELNADREWQELLEGERQTLFDFAESLEEQGFVLDRQGRTSSVRIRLEDNSGISESEMKGALSSDKLPDELIISSNLGHTDILLKNAGKDNAAGYLMEKNGLLQGECAGIGDDINDIPFLELMGRAYVLESSFAPVINKAKESGWHISLGSRIDGIDEILSMLLYDAESDGDYYLE